VLKRLLAVTAVCIAAAGGARVSAAPAPGDAQITVNAPPTATPSDATPATADTGNGAVDQTLTVAVKGGTLKARPGALEVTLQWDGARNRYRGRATYDVVDARGTLPGWTASAILRVPSGLRNGAVFVRPARPAVVDGADAGLAAGGPIVAHDGGTVVFGRAASGNGGGTYRVIADLELPGLDATHPGAITVSLKPTVI